MPRSGDGASECVLALLHEMARDSGLARAPEAITLETKLETELGLDSLGRAELIARIERALGTQLPDEALLAATARDLLALAGSSARSPALSALSAQELGGRDQREAGRATGPADAQTLLEVLDWHQSAHGERVHLLLYGAEARPAPITYNDLTVGASRVAARLSDAGLRVGASVALMLPTGVDYFFGFFGILMAGAVPVPIYPPARPEQLEDHLRRHAGILDNANAQFLITVPEAVTVARLLQAWVPSLKGVLTPDSFSVAAPSGHWQTARSISTDQTALLQYTSGSTGAPKGVILSHADLLANIRAMGEAVAVHSGDCFVSWLPLYHDMGLIGAWLGSLYFGVPLVSMSPLAFLARPIRWLQAIHDHRGTLSAAPNFAYELCLKRIKDEELATLDLSCWRRALNGAEPVSADTLERFAARFASCGLSADALAPVYGLAEAAVGVTFPPPRRGPRIDCIDRQQLAERGRALAIPCADPAAKRVVSCGLPLPGYRLRVVDRGGRALPERTEGLLQFQGPSATRGYFRNSEASAQLIDHGWHSTGDRAYLAGGELHLTGRVKDMIIRGGRNLYPYEVEEAVGEVPGVRKGCVVAFAADDPTRGSERLVLVAETRERDPRRRAALEQAVRARATDILGLPPDEIVLAPVRAVPKTSSGKLRRGETRERWQAGQLLSRPAPPVWQLVRIAAAGFAARGKRFLSQLPASLYAGYAWLLFLLIAPWVWLGIMLSPRQDWAWMLIGAGVRSLRWLALVPLEVSGRYQLPARGERFILVSNHQSYLDAMALAEAIGRPIAFVAKRELAINPLVRLPLARLGTLFVERFDLLRSSADSSRFGVALQQHKILGFFPEGTFRDEPGLLPFRMGAFIAAAQAGVPVLPVAIRGTRELMRGRSFFPRPGRAAVEIGSPVMPAGSNWASAVQLREATRGFILSRAGEPDAAN